MGGAGAAGSIMHHLGYHVEMPIKIAFDDHHGTGPAAWPAQRWAPYACITAFEEACWVPPVLGCFVVVVRHDAACTTVVSRQTFLEGTVLLGLDLGMRATLVIQIAEKAPQVQ